jgi:hypothetical protein
MLQQLRRYLLQKPRWLAREVITSATAGPAAGQCEAVLRAGDADVEQTPLLGDGVVPHHLRRSR